MKKVDTSRYLMHGRNINAPLHFPLTFQIQATLFQKIFLMKPCSSLGKQSYLVKQGKPSKHILIVFVRFKKEPQIDVSSIGLCSNDGSLYILIPEISQKILLQHAVGLHVLITVVSKFNSRYYSLLNYILFNMTDKFHLMSFKDPYIYLKNLITNRLSDLFQYLLTTDIMNVNAGPGCLLCRWHQLH